MGTRQENVSKIHEMSFSVFSDCFRAFKMDIKHRLICSDSVAKTFFKSQSVIGNKILSAEFNRAAVCSSKMLPDLISYYI